VVGGGGAYVSGGGVLYAVLVRDPNSMENNRMPRKNKHQCPPKSTNLVHSQLETLTVSFFRLLYAFQMGPNPPDHGQLPAAAPCAGCQPYAGGMTPEAAAAGDPAAPPACPSS
jgi:hypothetical protein